MTRLAIAIGVIFDLFYLLTMVYDQISSKPRALITHPNPGTEFKFLWYVGTGCLLAVILSCLFSPQLGYLSLLHHKLDFFE